MTTQTKERLGIAVFGVCALIFLLVGYNRINDNLLGPQKELVERIKKNKEQRFEFEMQKKISMPIDTDADGLSDLEEQTVYETSAFMADTDSDGVDDGVEIARGENPLCAEGNMCLAGTFGVKFTESQNASSDDLLGGIIKNKGEYGENVASNQQKTSELNVSIEDIRKMLIEEGVDPASLSGISDDELRKIYSETVSSQEFSEQAKVLGAFQNQNPAQIREILKQQGIPSDELDKITDEELIQLFKEALSE